MSEQPVINILGEKVALGPLRRELVPDYHRWANDFTGRRNEALPNPVTEEQASQWYEEASRSQHDAYFTIYQSDTLRAVGIASLRQIDDRNRSAMFAISIGEPDARGKGHGTETTSLMLDYAFTALGLHSVWLSVYEYNLAGRRAYEKDGFKECGRRRQAWWMGGRYWDEIYMDCLATEFESPVLGRIFTPEEAR